MQHITAPELANRLADPLQTKPLLLDVREPWEFENCHIPNAVLMSMQTDYMKPLVSMSEYISFVTMMVIAFG